MDIDTLKEKFIAICMDRKALLYGSFTLNSGVQSNVFFNSGVLSDAEAFSTLADLLVQILIDSKLDFDVIVGLPYKGISIAAAMCIKYWERTGKRVSYAYHRKELKDHGEMSIFVGADDVFAKGSKVVIIDDVLTSGKALLKGLNLIEPLGVDIVGIVHILNREVTYGKVAQTLRARGIGTMLEALTLEELQRHAQQRE